MFQIELHFHTAEASHCGKVPAEEGVRMYRDAGYSGIVVTDHFSRKERGGPGDGEWDKVCTRFLEGYYAAKAAAGEADFSVFLGMEIRFPYDENDFLVYGFSEDFLWRHPWIYMKDVKELKEIADREGLYIVQAHPFRPKCFLADTRCLHGIEVYNGNPRHNSHNERALYAAGKYNLGMTVGSDFHQPEDISLRRAGFSRMPCTEQELAEMLRKGEFAI